MTSVREGDSGLGSSPTLTPTPGRADLTVQAIRVRGKEPSGQNDCDPGNNDITVVVKNEGTGPAGGFVTRLEVDDDDDAKEKTVQGLDAGKDTMVVL